MGLTINHNDECLNKIREDGQQECHVILPNDKRKKFIRPVRQSYIHLKCGGLTSMPLEIAETYAVNPSYYSGTFCVHCGNYFPVGENGEFVWEDISKVGT